MNTEANIKINKNGGKVIFISVAMPICVQRNNFGNLSVQLPLLDFETIASDGTDAKKAIKEAIVSFCIIAEKFGRGIEKELQELGWENEGEDNLVFKINGTGSILEEIFNTGESYVNPHLRVAKAA